jgi:hypothetical protein
MPVEKQPWLNSSYTAIEKRTTVASLSTSPYTLHPIKRPGTASSNAENALLIKKYKVIFNRFYKSERSFMRKLGEPP